VLVFSILVACVTLWAASSVLARRITRPLTDLVRVTREIGAGKLSSRVGLGRHHAGEIGVLADAVNDMAVRIERQMRDQRELLAAVSHEIRSPLARLRVLTELSRNGDHTPATLAKIEREVSEIDALVGKLLAGSRIDFGALSLQTLPARDVALRELERAGLEPDLLRDESGGARIEVDATLLGRALANLIENAAQHAAGVAALVIRRDAGSCVFSVNDTGPGFSPEKLARAFDAFYRGGSSTARAEGEKEREEQHSSLGLGLALVERIARAHGGRAWLENRSTGGAAALLAVPLAPDDSAA
jgi:signal transduction histidine kinase